MQVKQNLHFLTSFEQKDFYSIEWNLYSISTLTIRATFSSSHDQFIAPQALMSKCPSDTHQLAMYQLAPVNLFC